LKFIREKIIAKIITTKSLKLVDVINSCLKDKIDVLLSTISFILAKSSYSCELCSYVSHFILSKNTNSREHNIKVARGWYMKNLLFFFGERFSGYTPSVLEAIEGA